MLFRSLYAPYIYKQLENDIKPSLAKDENDVSVSSIAVEGVGNKEEFVTFNFSMAEWQESTSQQRKELVQQINKKLGDSYYYGIAQTRDNTISASSPDSVKLTKQFGDYYYDYSIIMPTPFAFPNNDTELQKELIENSTKGIYSSVCKIEPVHNFYNKEYQEIANNNSEQLLYNYYSLYYYILENLDQKVKDNFFNNNLLPILKKYYSFLQNTSVPKDLLNKLAKNAVDTTKDYNKRIIEIGRAHV